LVWTVVCIAKVQRLVQRPLGRIVNRLHERTRRIIRTKGRIVANRGSGKLGEI
jgi:hypothetical protein